MRSRTPMRLAAVLGLLLFGSLPSMAQTAGRPEGDLTPHVAPVVSSDVGSRVVRLGVGKSIVIDFPRDIKDVLVAEPKIANAVVRTSRRAYIIAVDKGATNIVFFDGDGNQMAGYDIEVDRPTPRRTLQDITEAIARLVPNSHVMVESVGDGIVLSGTVSSQLEAQQAYDIASHFVSPNDAFNTGANNGGINGGSASGGAGSSSAAGGAGGNSVSVGASPAGLPTAGQLNGASASKVVNMIVVRGRDQILLKVVVAEVERDLIKQLGINLQGALNTGTATINFNNTNPFTAFGQSLSGSSITAGWKGLNGTLQAMEQAGVIHTLAEPNLTAISGETATFLAGGEFPILNGYSCTQATTASAITTCQPSIEYKKFGVGLNFTPVVLSEGRISLRVMTEVSDITSQNSLTIPIPGTTNTVTVPAIRTRRADTTVEIPSGGSLAMAGMIQDSTKHNINGLPGLMELPILGPLFKSNDYVNQRTELMVIVTPYVVHAVAPKDLSRPDDGFADPSDPAQVLLGRFNRIYGVGGTTDPPDNYRGKYGFILD
ncbi:MAG TPA: type II and III secretion system protein family protein [Xanthobacteraceae bacterium]